jgi:uncharacterized membrane protein YidH (DUF202 family)
MPPNLRLSLTIFTVGFALEAGEDAYHLLPGATTVVSGTALFLIGAVTTLLGLIFLTLGRHEWNELHHARVRHAHLTFLVVVLLAAAAAIPTAFYAYEPNLAIPAWITYEIAAAIAASLFFTFILYAIIVYHLLGTAGRGLLVAALVAAVPVVAIVGYYIAGDIPSYLATVRSSPTKLTSLIEPVLSYLSYMFIAYALFAVAFIDAHRRVARGLEPPTAEGSPVVPVGASPP